MSDNDLPLVAHLLRRAGFGASRDELEEYVAKGYEATVKELVYPEPKPTDEPDVLQRYYHGQLPDDEERFPGEDLLLRYYPDISRSGGGFIGKWVYRMVNSKNPLKEKMALWCHHVFATGGSKSGHPRSNRRQIETFGHAEVVVIARLAAHPKGARAGHHPARVERQIAGQVMVKLVAARLGLEGQREGAVGVDVDGLDGVHLNGHGKAHCDPPNSAGGAGW